MATVVMAANGFGGLIQGNFGNYQVAADGTVTINTSDVTPMLLLGMTFIQSFTEQYSTPIPPAAATVGGVVASTALSNGTLAVGTNPTVPRPVTFEVGTGTAALTGGTAVITYSGNDGQTGSDTLAISAPASGATTLTLSRGVDTISSIVISGVTGGTSPWVRMSTTTAISLPVSKGTVDLAVVREYDGTNTVAVGSLTTTLASIVPTTAANGTLNFSFLYTYNSPGT